MTDKQIIIDGFNLEYIKELLYNGQRSAITTNIFEAIIEELECKEQECEELKKQHQADKGLITSTGKMNYQLLQEYDKLKTALTEIKEIANRIYSEVITENWQSLLAKQILQKISEVEDE